MNDIQLSKLLGYFSLALGAYGLLAHRRITRALGVGSSGLVQAFGARELAAGVMVLTKPDTATPVWGRVAGDALDAAVLLGGLRGNRQRGNATAALLFVLGTAALDVAVATALTRREQQALQTARRTRIASVPAKA